MKSLDPVRKHKMASSPRQSGRTTSSGMPKRRRDRAAKQQALLCAATKLFASRGYEATTTREIAASAGCAEGLIHRYFNGKEGLLLTIIQDRVSSEVVDLNAHVPLAQTFSLEFFQLVEWELQRMWEDRDFLRVIIPRALLDPELGKVLSRVATSRHAEAIVERLAHFKECQSLPLEELHGLARFIGLLGFGFGFLRPVAFGQDRARAKVMAHEIAKILLRRM
jgi:TetR/AcrR family transcriptional regulator, regulator of cefoperazone and chloramphenicol sensitivity